MSKFRAVPCLSKNIATCASTRTTIFIATQSFLRRKENYGCFLLKNVLRVYNGMRHLRFRAFSFVLHRSRCERLKNKIIRYFFSYQSKVSMQVSAVS